MNTFAAQPITISKNMSTNHPKQCPGKASRVRNTNWTITYLYINTFMGFDSTIAGWSGSYSDDVNVDRYLIIFSVFIGGQHQGWTPMQKTDRRMKSVWCNDVSLANRRQPSMSLLGRDWRRLDKNIVSGLGTSKIIFWAPECPKKSAQQRAHIMWNKKRVPLSLTKSRKAAFLLTLLAVCELSLRTRKAAWKNRTDNVFGHVRPILFFFK